MSWHRRKRCDKVCVCCSIVHKATDLRQCVTHFGVTPNFAEASPVGHDRQHFLLLTGTTSQREGEEGCVWVGATHHPGPRTPDHLHANRQPATCHTSTPLHCTPSHEALSIRITGCCGSGSGPSGGNVPQKIIGQLGDPGTRGTSTAPTEVADRHVSNICRTKPGMLLDVIAQQPELPLLKLPVG